MELLFEKFFALLGRVVFPRRQQWEQRRLAKIYFCVCAFSLLLGAMIMVVIKMIYNKTKA